ncbi:MAG: hypothetical protein ACM3QS_08665 [Bacteroidota bacterium]
MTGMKAYYASRAVVSAVFGALFIATGSPWWAGAVVSLAAFGWFLLAPRIGRYSVHPEFGVTALRRDERSQAINDKAARNAFVVSMLALGGLLIYLEWLAVDGTPLSVLKWVLILGVLVYYASDFWLRRQQS